MNSFFSLVKMLINKVVSIDKSKRMIASVVIFIALTFSIILLRSNSTLGQDFKVFEENGKYGCQDSSGEVVIPAEYDMVLLDNVDNRLCAVINSKEYWYYNIGAKKKSEQFELPFDIPSLSSNASERDKQAYEGRLLINRYRIQKFLIADPSLYNGIICVYRNGKYGFINRDFKVVIQPKYSKVGSPSKESSLIPVQYNGKYGFINKSAKEILKFEYDDAGSFEYDLARVKRGDKWGYINDKGVTIIPIIYDSARDFHEGLAAVGNEGKQGFINTKGELVIPMDFDDTDVSFFSEGVVRIRKGGKYGYIDKKGNLITKVEFDRADMAFEKGKAEVSKDGRDYFINTEGERLDDGEMINEDRRQGLKGKLIGVEIGFPVDPVSKGYADANYISIQKLYDSMIKKVVAAMDGDNLRLKVWLDDDKWGCFDDSGFDGRLYPPQALMIRYFDRNGKYLGRFVTDDKYMPEWAAQYFGHKFLISNLARLSPKPDDNVYMVSKAGSELSFRINSRDSKYIEVIEVSFDGIDKKLLMPGQYALFGADNYFKVLFAPDASSCRALLYLLNGDMLEKVSINGFKTISSYDELSLCASMISYAFGGVESFVDLTYRMDETERKDFNLRVLTTITLFFKGGNTFDFNLGTVDFDFEEKKKGSNVYCGSYEQENGMVNVFDLSMLVAHFL